MGREGKGGVSGMAGLGWRFRKSREKPPRLSTGKGVEANSVCASGGGGIGGAEGSATTQIRIHSKRKKIQKGVPQATGEPTGRHVAQENVLSRWDKQNCFRATSPQKKKNLPRNLGGEQGRPVVQGEGEEAFSSGKLGSLLFSQ